MKKSSTLAPEAAAAIAGFRPKPPDLELPIAPDFLSRPPRIELAKMFQRCEELLPWKTSQPGFEQRRLEQKCDAEFTL